MGTYGSTWQERGYCGSGDVSALLGTLRGRRAIVCGGAAGVFDELEVVLAKVEDPVIFAANDVGVYLPRLDHFVTLHTDNLGPWKNVRWLHAKVQENCKYHAIAPRPFVDYVWDKMTPLFALSGYFAMQIAWVMGAEQIILCGCPGTQTRRFFEATPRGDFGYGLGPAGSDKGIKEQLEREMKRLPDFKAAVKSMSGWTKEFFGGI